MRNLKNTVGTLILFILLPGLLFPQRASEISQSQNLPLNQEVRMASTKALQTTLNELIAHRHAVQQCHWNVQGPRFYALHDLLGHFYTDLDAVIDVVAERQVILGSPADGRPSYVGKNTDMEPLPEGMIDDQAAIELLISRTKTLSDRLYERIEEVGEKDLVTQDLFIQLAGMLDQQLWKLRSLQE
jgi:starvation-inducible DNA-binding protein